MVPILIVALVLLGIAICILSRSAANLLGRSRAIVNILGVIWSAACFYILFFEVSPGSLGGTGAFLSLWLSVLLIILKSNIKGK